ncbi:MAG: PucR family transcriptional regulator [Chloroflexota bacterium]
MTVTEVMKLAMPPGAAIAGGAAGAGATVTWATTFRSRPPALDHLEGGEMVLLSPAAVHVVDASLSLARIIGNLRQRRVSAIAVAGAVDAEAKAAADEAALAVVALPAEADLHGLERSIIGLLVNKQAELQTRAGQVQRQLTQAAMQGKGLAGIARELSHATGKSVAILDPELEELARAGPATSLGGPQMKVLRSLLKGPVAVGQDPPAEKISSLRQAVSCWAAVIPVNNRAGGLVVVAAGEEDLTELDGLIASRTATVCAVEMVKERAVVEAETKLQGDFVRNVLRGSYASESSALSHAMHIDWDLSARYGVAALDLSGRGEQAAGAIRAAIGRRGIRPLVSAWEGQAVFVYPLPPATTGGAWRDVAEQIRAEVAGTIGGRPLSAGLGRPNSGLRGLQRSFAEAEQALHAGERLFGPGQTVAFGDLGAYRVLSHLHGMPELAAFEDETLGRLLEYDGRTGSHLLETLEAFFSSNGNLSKTAELLFVHRNTLMYRLNRVQELTNLSLDDAETRFDLQLALKMYRVNVPSASTKHFSGTTDPLTRRAGRPG